MKKVLWLPRWYPNKFDPFDGNFVEAHARVAAEVADIAVLFVHSDPGLKKMFEVKESVDPEKGFPVIRVYYKKPNSFIPGFNSLLHGLRFQTSQLLGYEHIKAKWGEPDISHVHVLSRPAWLARRLKKPYFITEHASRYFPENPFFKGLIRRWWTRKVVRDAATVTTVSDALRSAMEKHGLQGNYQRLSNVIRTEIFSLATTPPLPFKLVHTSTMHNNPKNTGGILRACSLLKASNIDFKLDMIGDGPERTTQEALANDLGLSDNVTFHGNISLKAVAEKLKESHALVMFSWYETQSIVVLEALACGLPVIATAVGGLAEHLKPEFGVAVPPGDEAALAAGIEKVMKNYTSYDREAMRKYVLDLASVEAIREQFGEMYRG